VVLRGDIMRLISLMQFPQWNEGHVEQRVNGVTEQDVRCVYCGEPMAGAKRDG
jgi:hypothetical protein